ncbi:MAG: MFS transporter [Paracoccaceae bacterium]|nr:MFS transporter [Paracoccaceae bacterium]
MTDAARNVALYPWFKFFQNLLFWQATWFLFFQSELSAAQAILIYVFYDIATTVLEVPSGYMSDRVGRRFTLILSALAGLLSATMQAVGSEFWVFALAQVAMGIHIAFASGTDSSLLYESLAEDGREDEIEAHELKAWRFNFVALAISAVLGGAMALWSLRVPYLASAVAFVFVAVVVFRFREPKHAKQEVTDGARLDALRIALRQPVLMWLFALSALMYGFSHLPFVFGQPYILGALAQIGMEANAPLVSGAVTACMMLVSVLTSWMAPGLRERIGLTGILLLAFGLQVFLVGGLALTGSVFAIALLLLRMVPDSFSRPFILARIQTELPDGIRATYLSLQSLAGRILFAASLYLASGSASDVGEMAPDEVRLVLGVFAAVGCGFLAVLAVLSRLDGLARVPGK